MFGKTWNSVHNLASVLNVNESFVECSFDLTSFYIILLDYQIVGWKAVSNCRNFNIQFAPGDEGYSTR